MTLIWISNTLSLIPNTLETAIMNICLRSKFFIFSNIFDISDDFDKLKKNDKVTFSLSEVNLLPVSDSSLFLH